MEHPEFWNKYVTVFWGGNFVVLPFMTSECAAVQI